MDRKLAMDDAPQNFGWILLLTKVPKIHPIWYSHPSLRKIPLKTGISGPKTFPGHKHALDIN